MEKIISVANQCVTEKPKIGKTLLLKIKWGGTAKLNVRNFNIEWKLWKRKQVKITPACPTDGKRFQRFPQRFPRSN